MFTYDAFTFIQVTFLFFILMGMGAGLLNQTGTVGATANEPRRSDAVGRPAESLART